MTIIEQLPDAALDGDIAILGRKGGGKTFTAKGIAERLLDMKRRVLILDPLGVWAGLRTAANGEDPGYQIAIFGGQYGDEPLDPALAVPLAQIIAGENLPTIIDLSELTKTAQGTFLYKFLHELRRVNREALTIVLEEADVFAPQNPQGDDSKLLHSEIDWISRRGRFRGFRLISITQRPARLSKDVLTQCSTLIAHKLPAPQDRDAVKAWVEGNGDRDLAKQVFDTLAGLDVGEGWVWSPEHDILQRMRFPRIKTLDTSATPKAGETRIEPKTLAQVDMSGIRKALAVAKAERAADDRKGKSSNERAKSVAPDQTTINEADQRGYGRGIEEAKQALKTTRFSLLHAQDALGAALAHIDAQLGTAQIILEDAAAADPPPKPLPVAKPAQVRAAADPNAPPAAAAKLLSALQRVPGGTSWENVCIIAGVLYGNGYFYAGKRWLLDTARAQEADDIVLASASSLKEIGGFKPSPSRAEILQLWRGRVKPHAAALLDVIAGRRGEWIDTARLANAASMKPGNGHWYSGIAAIRDPGLIEQDGNRFRLSEFVRGLP
jgi:hypothetical protein